MREVKYRQPFYKEDGTFSHFSYWGRIREGVFQSPSCCNFAWPREDEQFTGLRDKNGKEIYEGDIIETSNSDDPSYEVVEYRGSAFGIGCGVLLEDVGLSECTVAGNIHENGDLLK